MYLWLVSGSYELYFYFNAKLVIQHLFRQLHACTYSVMGFVWDFTIAIRYREAAPLLPLQAGMRELNLIQQLQEASEVSAAVDLHR